LTVTDAAGNTTTNHYDAANRVCQVDYPASGGGTVINGSVPHKHIFA